MKVKTDNNEAWEIDFWVRTARREGAKWKTYTSVSVPHVGARIVLVWNDIGQSTLTGVVTEIEENESDISFFKNMAMSMALGGAAC